MNVYLWPSGLVTAARYSPPTRTRTTQHWDGAPGQRTEHVQRSTVELRGVALWDTAADLDIIVDRLRGGVNLCAVWEMGWRKRNGWPAEPTLDASGNETFDGRSVDLTGTGSADSTSLSVTGLNASEVVPKGAMVRIGDYRHRTLSDATADGTGAATLMLASPLRAAVANADTVTIPGDLFVGTLVGGFEISASDINGSRPFRAVFSEVYADEVTGGFTWQGL